ncbi:MAG: undecaprenyl-diphosphatase UppP [Firmicutes bacterium]|nr:undecaprenyl-diphosphatase UppP [Bacillota bacterium]
MNLLQAIVLGIVQGLTEFLPISSSAHLVLFPSYLGWNISAEQNISFYVVVHLGTLLAVLSFFYSDIKKLIIGLFKSIGTRKLGNDPHARLAWFLIIGTLPAGVVYILIKKLLENTLESPVLVSIFLLVTGVLLISSELLGKRKAAAKDMRLSDVLFIGFTQGLSILPGISRSGSTIAAGLFRGLTREEAARFSFLLSIPAIIAGAVEDMKGLMDATSHISSAMILIAGFIAASVTGYLAIKYFIDYLKKHSLYVFALYCFVVGTLTLVLAAFKVIR